MCVLIILTTVFIMIEKQTKKTTKKQKTKKKNKKRVRLYTYKSNQIMKLLFMYFFFHDVHIREYKNRSRLNELAFFNSVHNKRKKFAKKKKKENVEEKKNHINVEDAICLCCKQTNEKIKYSFLSKSFYYDF